MGFLKIGGKSGVRLWSRSDGTIGFSAGKPRKARTTKTSRAGTGKRAKTSRPKRGKSLWSLF